MKQLGKWKVLRSELAFDHRWYKVRRDVVELPDGRVVDDYFLSVRPDVAMVFALTRQQEVIFVRQYRHGAGEVLLELPAGTFDPTIEAATGAAMRELREETGFGGDRLIPLATLHDNPVKETNKIHLFFAPEVWLQGHQELDITEAIEVVRVPVAELPQWIARGDLCVSGTVAAVCLGLRYLEQHRVNPGG